MFHVRACLISARTMATVSSALQRTVKNAAQEVGSPFSPRTLMESSHVTFCTSRSGVWPLTLEVEKFLTPRRKFTHYPRLSVRCLTWNASIELARNFEGGAVASTTKEAALSVKNCLGLLAFYADHHVVPLPPDHRFPMTKYRATRMLLEEDASLRDILVTYPGPQASEDELCLVHEKSYIEKFKAGNWNAKEQRAVGFPWSPELVNRSSSSCGNVVFCVSEEGTIAAMHAVMLGVTNAAANIAGGTHHAFPGHGEGFCVYNDIAVAAMVALLEYPASCNIQSPILVIDLDVHQGNGTAKIFEKDDRVITFSMHGEKNYPWKTKMKSNYDIDLPDDTGDEEYLAILREWLPRLFKQHKPGLVFFQAGVDALRDDSFGRLSLTR